MSVVLIWFVFWSQSVVVIIDFVFEMTLVTQTVQQWSLSFVFLNQVFILQFLMLILFFSWNDLFISLVDLKVRVGKLFSTLPQRLHLWFDGRRASSKLLHLPVYLLLIWEVLVASLLLFFTRILAVAFCAGPINLIVFHLLVKPHNAIALRVIVICIVGNSSSMIVGGLHACSCCSSLASLIVYGRQGWVVSRVSPTDITFRVKVCWSNPSFVELLLHHAGDWSRLERICLLPLISLVHYNRRQSKTWSVLFRALTSFDFNQTFGRANFIVICESLQFLNFINCVLIVERDELIEKNGVVVRVATWWTNRLVMETMCSLIFVFFNVSSFHLW